MNKSTNKELYKIPFLLRMIDYILLFIMLPYDYFMVFINPFEWVKKPDFLHFPSYDEKIKAEKEKKEWQEIFDRIKHGGLSKEEDRYRAMIGLTPKYSENYAEWNLDEYDYK